MEVKIKFNCNGYGWRKTYGGNIHQKPSAIAFEEKLKRSSMEMTLKHSFIPVSLLVRSDCVKHEFWEVRGV